MLLSASLASPSASHAKTPLNVVFIIDTHLQAGAEEAVAFLRRSLVRVLLYFQANMDPRFQWTYQFFNSRLNQDVGLIPNRVLQSLTLNTITHCIDEYRRIITEETALSLPSSKGGIAASTMGVSPCYNLRRQLVHSLADFGLGIASYQSPMKPSSTLTRSQSLQKHFPPVNIRNYMYVFSPLPRSWMEIVSFLEGKRQQQSDIPMSGLPRRNDILEVLKGVKDAFFDQGLWDRFLDQHTSLSWIDTSIGSGNDDPAKTHTRISAMTLIRSTLELIMKAFGGHIIPQYILCQSNAPQDIYSFASVFQTYRSLQIHPGLGIKMSRNSWQALPSTPVGLFSDDIQPVKVMWSGDLTYSESSKFLCSIDLAEPSPLATADEDTTSRIDEIEALQVIRRIPGRVLSANVHLIKVTNTMICFPQDDNEEPCEHASYLLRSLRAKSDALIIEITFLSEDTEDVDYDTGEQDQQNTTYTRFALLHSTVPGSGIMEVLEDGSSLQDLSLAVTPEDAEVRPFSMAMMEKSWSKLGAFVDRKDTRIATRQPYRLDRMPDSILSALKQQRTPPESFNETRPPASKPAPGELVQDTYGASAEIESAVSIDDVCLEMRKTYIKYLYCDDYSLTDYVNRLNGASKEITALAAKQSTPLKEAQQKMVAFLIEFLRIWPSRLSSKYKQIAKDVNAGKFSESKTQDHYVILDDERPALDLWKAETMRSVKDSDVRMHLRKLKTKDTQIQIVQNLHILLLIDKYGLDENKPFKKDPGALKTVNLFMDELCISASIDSHPEPGLRSPQTPRSKDMDPAKKFFTRVVARYYESALPSVVERLSIKCGVEKSLLMSPRPARGTKRAGIKRSISMGVLQKPSPLDFSVAMHNKDDAGGAKSSGLSMSTDTSLASKSAISTTSRQSTSDNPARNVLNSSIFRNRQVVMTRGSVKGVGLVAPSSSSLAGMFGDSTTTSKARPGPARSKSMTALTDLEDEDAPPKLAKLKLKKFYHDKESEEVLKLFRRQRPLSKADAVATTPQHDRTKVLAAEVESSDEDDDDDLGALGKYLPSRGTTSWGVIKSENVSKSSNNANGSGSATSSIGSSNRNNDHIKSPSTIMAQRRSPLRRRNTSPIRLYPSLSSFSTSFISHQPTTLLQESESVESMNRVPSTPTRRAQINRERSFASHIRGAANATPDLEALGSPGKRRRGLEEDEMDAVEMGIKSPSSPLASRTSSYRTSATASGRSLLSLTSPKFMRQQGRNPFMDELRATRPDRKRIILDATEIDGGLRGGGVPSKTVLVPRTPTASLPSTGKEFELLSTPKKSIGAGEGMFIASPTPARDLARTRRQIDLSMFAADE
ncbi:hypothetical protein BGZ98_008359 [Dissophora globulifera]|nr:hypothetical protein BGZ98_008359 [Dissophora globulifera]